MATVRFLELVNRYRERVQFIVVRPDFGHNQNKPREQRFNEALAWAEQVGLSELPFLMDTEEKDLRKFGADPQRSWQCVYILNTQGEIVYQHSGDTGMHRYYEVRAALDRLLDPAFDRAWREGFPEKPRTLPQQEEGSNGVTFTEDFESYVDTYDFNLHPRWGEFDPDYVHARGDLSMDGGRDGSKAAHLHGDHSHRIPRSLEVIKHSFPRELTHGRIRFYIRRSERNGWKQTPESVMRVTLVGADVGNFGTIDIRGIPMKETFQFNEVDSGIQLSDTQWHEVMIEAAPAAMLKVSVDGTTIGELESHPLTAIGFRSGHHGSYLDDVELFYAAPVQ